MISSVSSAHASNAQQATQHSTKALPETPAKQQKTALPEDTVTLKSAAGGVESQRSNG
jgi:hypothetical protein